MTSNSNNRRIPLFSVKVPRLSGMTEEQRNRALEDYMRESQRQLRMILDAQGLINEDDAAVTTAQQTANDALETAQAAQETADAAATPSDVEAAIAESEARVADYIVDTDTSGIWTTRIWASGKAECWGRYEFVVAASGWDETSPYFYKDGSVDFPSGFFSGTPDDVQMFISDSSANSILCWLAHRYNTTSATAHFRVMRTAQYSQKVKLYINIHAIGTWQTEEA